MTTEHEDIDGINIFHQSSDEHVIKESQQKNILQFFQCSQSCCVSFIDIVGSTKTTSGLSEIKLTKFYSTILNHFAGEIKKFEGKIVKNIGDALLYYFPENSSKDCILQCIECNMHVLKGRTTLNTILNKENLPPISFRTSGDYGKILFACSPTSNINDIFGPTVNMCSKINHDAPPNTMIIGGDMYQKVRSIDKFRFEETPGYSISGFKNKYPTYLVRE